MPYQHTIAVNARLLLKDKLEGMGRFAHEILRRVTPVMTNVHFVFFFDRTYDDSFIYSSNITPLVCAPATRHVFLYYWWLQHSLRPALNRLQPDLFFSPDGLCVLNTKVPQLPVIHDINFEHHPEFHRFWAARYYRFFFPRFARNACSIITVSEFSRRDISITYGIPLENISVVWNGVSEHFTPVGENISILTRQKYTSGRPYFVYVGSLHPRKNITGLLRAFYEFKQIKKSNHALVLAGPMYWGMKEIFTTLRKLSLEEDVIFTHRLTDEELNRVIGSSVGMVYVPLYEGFGIPVIEGYAAGVPVITSNVTSLPEVAGKAAILVHPDNSQQIAREMVRLVEHPMEARTRVEAGFEEVKKYSWDTSAQKVVEILEKQIKQK